MLTKRFVAGVVSLVTLVGSTTVALVIGSASPAAALEGTVPGNTASSWQTNGRVDALAYANGKVYLGGDFTSVRPPGAAAGTSEVARNHLAAFDASTGALVTSFDPGASATVWGLAVSPDGNTLYVGGDFTTIGGATRNHVAAFSTSDGALLPWDPNTNNRVRSLAASPTTVYLGGTFASVNGGTVKATRVAAVDPVTGTAVPVTTFSATADEQVYAMALSKQYDHLYLGGAFTAVDGNSSAHGAAAIDPQTGNLQPLPAASVIPTPSATCSSAIKTVVTDADSVYFGAEGTGGGCFDGTFSAHVSDGSLKWVSRCLGATQAIEVVNGVMYVGSHAHNDSADASWDPDAFPELHLVGGSGETRHLLARSTTTGKLASWYPDTNGGGIQSDGSMGLGPRSMATDGTQLFLGGEFTTVNGAPQQGFARFSPGTGDLTKPAKPAAPVAVARAGGKISVFVQPPVDIDDTDLVVRVYRDGATTPFATAKAHSLFWRQPILAFEDNGQALGTQHTYTADAIEANGSNVSKLSAASPPVTVTTTVPSYPTAVTADNPSAYWRMDEPGKPVGADSSDALTPGLYSGTATSMTFGQPGAVGDGDTAVTMDGSTGTLSSSAPLTAPTTYSVEAWIKTTTTVGGKIIGFGNTQNGYTYGVNVALSSTSDRQVYMTDDGRLVFGVWVGSPDTLTTSASYNDGQWHHIVATQGPNGMSLYVDAALVGHNADSQNQAYLGYWRVGGDSLSGWPNQPSSNMFAGTIDDIAVYPSALSETQVAAHYAASGRTPPPSPTPSPSPSPTDTTTPSPSPTDTTTPSPSPTDATTPSPSPTDATTPSPSPTETTPPPDSLPTLDFASPAAVLRGFSGPVTFTGTHFRPGAVTTVSATGVSQTAPATVVDSTHLRIPIAVAGRAPTGPVTVTVTDPDGLSASCGTCLQVTRVETKLTLTQSSRRVTYHHSVGLSARLTTADGSVLAGRAVRFFRRPHRGTHWTYMGRAYTGTSGYVQWHHRPYRSQDYYARYAGERMYLPTSSPIGTTYVRPHVINRLTATRVHPHTTVYVHGRVAPNLRHRYVMLQRYYHHRWHKVRVRRLNYRSRFSFPVRWGHSGVGYYRVTIHGVPGYVFGAGVRLRLRVGRVGTTVTLTVQHWHWATTHLGWEYAAGGPRRKWAQVYAAKHFGVHNLLWALRHPQWERTHHPAFYRRVVWSQLEL